MRADADQGQPALEALLREHLPARLPAGLADRVVQRLQLQAVRTPSPLELSWAHTWRYFPVTAAAALLLVAGLAAWNLHSRPEGPWLDRVLALPAETLDNALTTQWEDFS